MMLILTSELALGNKMHEVEPSRKLQFIENKGQWDNPATFLANVPGGQLFVEHNALHFIFKNQQEVANALKHPRKFEDDLTSYTIHNHAVRIEFAGSNNQNTSIGENPTETYYNYFVGNEPKYWQSRVKAYQKATLQQLYPHIDASLYSSVEGSLKYDFIVHPNGDVANIQLNYAGQTSIKLKNGELVVSTSVNSWVEQKPYAYQIINGLKQQVDCSFVLDKNTVSFNIDEYNHAYELVIDPQLIFSTYSGSSVDNFGHSATYDKDGDLYAAGIATSPTDFPNGHYPTTPGAFQQVWGGGNIPSGFPCDITISKYTPDGSALIYATYLGGSNNEYPHSLVTDKYNNLIVFGSTLSSNFPVKTGSYDVTANGNYDIILTKISADGTQLIGSTYIGGSSADGINVGDSLRMNYADEYRGEVIIDKSNDIIVASSTSSANFPITSNVYQINKSGRQDGCIFRLDSNLTILKASTFVGESNNDALYSLDVDTLGNIYFAGGTQSQTFSVSPNSHLANYRGGFADGIVGKINSQLTVMQNFRYWGSSDYDQAYFIKVDPWLNPVVFGQNFDSVPVIGTVYRNRNSSLFVTKFKPALDSIIFSTTLGDSIKKNALPPSAFMVDECGVIYGSVWGGSTNQYSHFNELNPSAGFISTTASLPTTVDALQTITDNSDFFLFALDKDAKNLLFGSYYGELGSADHVDGGTSRFDKKGVIYQSVCASCNRGTSGAFPTTVGSFSPTNQSPRCSNASFKLDFRKSNVVYASYDFSPKKFCLDSYVVVTFTNTSYNGKNHYWYVNGILKDTALNYADTIRNPGTYYVKLIEIDSSRCIIIDSTTQSFTTSYTTHASFTMTKDTCSSYYTFTNTSTPITAPIRWYFGGGDTASAQVIKRTFPANGQYQILLVTNPGSSCSDSAVKTLQYDSIGHLVKASFIPLDSIGCEPARFTFINMSNKFSTLKWYVNNILVKTTYVFDTFFYKGKYDVKLVSIDSVTCNKSDSSTHHIVVVPDTYPTFTFTQDNCTFTTHFTNTTPLVPGDTVFYFWDFGNGITSTQKDTSVKFDTAGTYKVKLITNKGLKCEESITHNVQVTASSGVLNAFFTATPLQGCTPLIMRFNNLSTNQQSQKWFYNNVLKSTNTNLVDTFKTDTVITVKLMIYSSLTCLPVDSFDTTITVNNSTKSKFLVVRDTCSAKVFFINQSTSDNAEPLNYLWHFGDGDTSTQLNPQHIYAKDSTYTISLITNLGTLCTDTSVQHLVYSSTAHLLNVSFTLNDSELCAPGIVKATNTSVGGTIYEWYVNNQLTSTSTNFNDTFIVPGNYHLTLRAYNPNSCFKLDSAGRTITIGASGLADFNIARDSCSLLVHFLNQSVSFTGLPIPYIWHFGDGDSSRETNPTHLYATTKIYTITLTTNAQTACADTAIKTYLIDGDTSQEVIIPNVFTPNNDGLNDCYRILGVSVKCDTYKVKIYNRWGEIYFESTDPSQCWNGKNDSGVNASEGVYYYIMEITKRDKPKIEKHGSITLLRE